MESCFAGATEIVQDWGWIWFSQDITAKLFARAARGIGVGIIDGSIRALDMEFCRPLAFEKSERPKLSHGKRIADSDERCSVRQE